MTHSDTRLAVIKEAKSWLGTPFVHQATIKGAGIGCGTLLTCVYGSVGIAVPSVEEMGHFSADWHLHTKEERYLEILSQFTRRMEAPETGDIAIFKFGRVYSHSAIIIEWPQVIHVMWRRTVEYADASKSPLAKHKVLFLTPFF